MCVAEQGKKEGGNGTKTSKALTSSGTSSLLEIEEYSLGRPKFQRPAYTPKK